MKIYDKHANLLYDDVFATCKQQIAGKAGQIKTASDGTTYTFDACVYLTVEGDTSGLDFDHTSIGQEFVVHADLRILHCGNIAQAKYEMQPGSIRTTQAGDSYLPIFQGILESFEILTKDLKPYWKIIFRLKQGDMCPLK